jgi:hypothetical protein
MNARASSSVTILRPSFRSMGARESDRNLNTDFQYDPEVATTMLLCRIRSKAIQTRRKTVQEAIDAALRTGHGLQVVYVMMHAGCMIPLLVGNLAEAGRRIEMNVDHGAENPQASWARCFDLVIRLRQGSEQDALIASYIRAAHRPCDNVGAFGIGVRGCHSIAHAWRTRSSISRRYFHARQA